MASMTITANGNGVPEPQKKDKMGDEKVEMAEVPLTSDTDKPEGAAEEPVVEKKEEKPKQASRFRNFFSRDKSGERKEKKEGEGEEKKEGEEVVAEKPPKRSWFTRKPKEQKENGPDHTDADGMTIGLNLLDRDEKGLNEHVKLSFEDVFAEPEGYHSFDCAWRMTHRIFTGTRSFVYRLLAVILAIPCSLIFGILFALATVLNIWACVPAARCLTIPGTWIAKLWNFLVRTVLDPCFRSCGLCLSSVHVRRYGLSTDTTADVAHIA